MTRDNIDELILQIQCCLGLKGYNYVRALEKGRECDISEIQFLNSAFNIISNWYEEDDVIQQEKLPYFVYKVVTAVATSTITNQSGTVLYTGTTSVASIVTGINASETDFTALSIDGLLWIFAPSAGYNGMSLAVSGAGAANLTPVTPYFQGGCEEKIADEPCLTASQANIIFETLKKNCNLCLSTIYRTSADAS